MCDWPDPRDPVITGKGAWLQTLNTVAPITDADGSDERAASIAFTWTGLQKLGLPAEALATFSTPFREGMYQEDRLRRLGDRVDGRWQGTVIDGGPLWSANIPVMKEARTPARELTLADIGSPKEPDELQVTTPITVHALLLLYEEDEGAAKAWATEVEAALGPARREGRPPADARPATRREGRRP